MKTTLQKSHTGTKIITQYRKTETMGIKITNTEYNNQQITEDSRKNVSYSVFMNLKTDTRTSSTKATLIARNINIVLEMVVHWKEKKTVWNIIRKIYFTQFWSRDTNTRITCKNIFTKGAHKEMNNRDPKKGVGIIVSLTTHKGIKHI